MPASNPSGGDLPLLYGQCANCLVFGWKQPLPAVLRKCSKCKVLQYCGESCQKEHWKLVHKHHCKKLAAVKMGEGGGLVGIFSPPPFADAELLDDPHDALVMLMQYVLQKIFYSNQPAFNKVQVQLFQLRELLKWTMETIWARKKICPVEVKDFSLYRHGEIFEETAVIQDENLAGQDSWLMLHLVWGRLFDNRCVGRVNSMKNPGEAIPEDFWVGVQQEVGPFPSRVADLIKAFSGTQFPSFQQLLQILCGGSLRQACSFCNTNITVASVYGEVKGSYGLGAPFVALLPYLPPIFGCGAFICAKGMGEQRAAHNKWRSGVGAMYIKLKPNKCDFCFKLTEELRGSAQVLQKITFRCSESPPRDQLLHLSFSNPPLLHCSVASLVWLLRFYNLSTMVGGTQLFEEAHLTGGNTRFCCESGRCSDYVFLTEMCPLLATILNQMCPLKLGRQV